MEKIAASRSGAWDVLRAPRLYPLLLVLLCALTYLPGLVRLPAVDRTEIIFADTTRAMVERGAWFDPQWRGTVHQFRPIGTFWVQALASAPAGPEHARDIRFYRIPGLLAVTLAVLALFWITAPVVGAPTAALAAALFAVTPLTALLTQLAIADGLALLPATLAMLALLRLYTGEEGKTGDASAAVTRRWAMLFWAAMGLGMLVNALHTPILVGITLLGLWVMDRDLSWLRRLHVLIGLPLALALAAPWMVVRVHQDGIPFSGLGVSKLLAALGGAQDMKLRAFPGTFLLAALLGFLPGTALLAPALLKLWNERNLRLARILLAWIAGYIIYLELLSSKPGTYTVQVMFPAMAMAVALLVMQTERDGPARWHAIPWPPLAALFALILMAAPYAMMREMPSLLIAPAAIATAGLFAWSAREGRSGRLKSWALSGAAGVACLIVSLTALIFPSLDRIWPARQVTRALEACPRGPIAVAGFREPSAYFVLGSDEKLLEADTLREHLVETKPGYLVGEARDDRLRIMSRFQFRKPRPVACVEAYNAMRGCPVFFTIMATGDTGSCRALEAFPCTRDFQARAEAARSNESGCD